MIVFGCFWLFVTDLNDEVSYIYIYLSQFEHTNIIVTSCNKKSGIVSQVHLVCVILSIQWYSMQVYTQLVIYSLFIMTFRPLLGLRPPAAGNHIWTRLCPG